jgi:Na+/melibiose symporter-like transporter
VLALGFIVTLVSAPESRDPGAARQIDWPGLVTFSAGLTGLVLALIQGKTWGWGSPETLLVLVGGIVSLLLFVLIERRVAHPIVELGLFRNKPYFGASAAAFAIVGTYWSVMFFEPQYLQDVLGHSPLEAGVLMLPIMVPLMIVSPFTGRLIARFGARELMTVGMVIGTIGIFVMTLVDSDSGYGLLFWGFLGFGIALAFVYAPMSTAAMEAMPNDKAGIAAGVLAMLRVGAGAVWLAVVGALFQHFEVEHRKDLGADATYAEVLDFALSRSFLVLVGLMVVGTVLTWAFVRGEKPAKRGHHAVLHAHGHHLPEADRMPAG